VWERARDREGLIAREGALAGGISLTQIPFYKTVYFALCGLPRVIIIIDSSFINLHTLFDLK